MIRRHKLTIVIDNSVIGESRDLISVVRWKLTMI